MSSMNNRKYMDLEEFIDEGYLQEVNRLFFHPLGLRMRLIVDEESGELVFGGIVDARDNPDEASFGFDEMDDDEIAYSIEKAKNVERNSISKKGTVEIELIKGYDL